MRTYRVYFRDGVGIVGRHDLLALDDREAIALADILCDACSDRCSSFEVWRDRNIVATRRMPRSPLGSQEIALMRQQAIVDHEDAIQRSNWAIASSGRLLKKLAELRAQLPRMPG